MQQTLAALPGRWAKLAYVAGLKGGGRYSHWGLERVHGEQQARQAMAEAHSRLLLEVLRGRLPQLLVEAKQARPETELEGYFRQLLERQEVLLPENAGAAARTHLTAVLTALLKLAAAQARASLRAA